MKSLFAKTDNFYVFKNHVFVLVIFLPNQNNPTAVWLTLIGMHIEKTWFLKIVKNRVMFFKWTLHVYLNASVILRSLMSSWMRVFPTRLGQIQLHPTHLLLYKEVIRLELWGRQFKFITLDHFKGLPDANVVFFTIAPSCIIFAELNQYLSFYFWGAGSKI